MKDFLIKNKTILIIATVFAISIILYIQYWVKKKAAVIVIDATLDSVNNQITKASAKLTESNTDENKAALGRLMDQNDILVANKRSLSVY